MGRLGNDMDLTAARAAVRAELQARLDWDADRLAAHRNAALADTVRHAIAESPWHRDRLGHLDPDALDVDGLADVPVMTKRDLMASWDSVVTDRDVTLDAARRHLERVDGEGLSPLLGRYFVFTTGGSTGEPGVFLWPLDAMARWGASAMRWGAVDGSPDDLRTAWVAARSVRHPSAAASVMAGPEGADLLVPVDQPLSEIVDRLNRLQPDALSMVCSMLPILAEAADRGELNLDLRRIMVFGDVLDTAALDAAEATFGVRPLESYPTTDVGHIGGQAPGIDGMFVNDDLLVVEGVDEDDRPVPVGTETHHLLVTSLHQRALPLIRYRIDDRVTFAPAPAERFSAFRRISAIDGRADDLFRYGDLLVHPHVFRSVLSRHAAVCDHRVEQTASGARVLVAGAVDADLLRGELEVALARAGLPSAVVSVDVVDAMPRTAVGKRQRFVPCA